MFKDYKLLFIGSNGLHSRAIHFDCSDDATATIFAEERRAEHVMELWHDKRMVAEFPKRQGAGNTLA